MKPGKKKLQINNGEALISEIFDKELRKKDVLFAFTKQIAQIKAKDDLMKLIREHFQTIFYFTHCTITVISEDKKTFQVYFIDPGSAIKNHKDYKELITRHNQINDGIYDTILQSEDPVIFKVGINATSVDEPFYIHVLQQSGIKELIGIPLAFENKQIGVLSFFSDKQNSFGKDTFPLIKNIVDYISLAVNNALANEAIKQREKEKEILLTASKELTAVRNKEELLPLLKKQFESFSFYSDVTIAKVDDSRKTFSAFIINDDPVRLSHPGYRQMAAAKHFFPDGVFEVALQAEKPVVFGLKVLANLPNARSYIKFLFENGTIEMVGVPLRDSNRAIGVLFLFSNRKLSLTELQLSLAQGIGNQLGAVVANILANEEIKNRENEKSILLSLSKELAAVRNKEDLFRVVNIKLKELFLVKGFAIALIDHERKTHHAFLIDLEESIKNHHEFNHVLSQDYSIEDGVVNRVLLSEDPVEFIVSDFSENAHTPVYVNFWKKLGIHTVIGTALKVGENNLGCLLFHIEQNETGYLNYNLLKSVCSQISIAIANILANESLQKRELEKSLLLTFSSELATARSKKGLATVIKQYLRDIFMIREYIITIRNEDEKTYSYFLHDLSAEEPTDEGFKIITSPNMPIKGAMTGAVLEADEPVIFNIANNIKTGKYSFLSESFWKAAGADNILGIKLTAANEAVGILWTQPGKINDSLLRGISAQISIAIANILANEKIEKQFEEINDYKLQLEEEKSYLQEQVGGGYTYSDVIGSGSEMQKVFQSLSQVSFASSTVLLLGETGTGKELIAKAIHNSSPRKERLMVKVNCAALPANLIESELFGHEKGSFTGATERRIGKFELANLGTLFLDEIGEMPLDLQVKLLRAIQEKEIERIGGKVTIKTDVRLIAATNRNLQNEVDDGRFRRDLYYRLNVFPITLPPLRERKEDIPLLVTYFTRKYAKNTGGEIKKISGKAMKELMGYAWPGNIRELEHLVERSILTNEGNTIKNVHLPVTNRNEQKYILKDDFLKTHEENERDHILKVLNKCDGKIFGPGGAADILKIHVSTLNSKISKLGIKKNKSYS